MKAARETGPSGTSPEKKKKKSVAEFILQKEKAEKVFTLTQMMKNKTSKTAELLAKKKAAADFIAQKDKFWEEQKVAAQKEKERMASVNKENEENAVAQMPEQDNKATEKAKEKAKKATTLTQWMRNPPQSKRPSLENTRMVWVNRGAGWEEEVYQPEKGCYNCKDPARYADAGKCADEEGHLLGMNWDRPTYCKECLTCNCARCLIGYRIAVFAMNRPDIIAREHLMLELTEGFRGDAVLDEEWCAQQDPIWAIMHRQNRFLEEDIGLYLRDMEQYCHSVRNEMGWQGVTFPETPNEGGVLF